MAAVSELRLLKKMDWLLVGVMVVLIGAGIAVIYTTPGHGGGFARRQAVWAAVGLVLFVAGAFFPYRRLSFAAYPFYGAMLLALALVLIAGEARHGGKRWLALGGLSVQPSEFAKLATIFVLAKFLADSRIPKSSWRYVLVPLWLCTPPMFLIFLQPNLGTALALIPVCLGMLYVAGVNGKKLALLLLGGCLALPPLWFQMKPYQKKRVLEFLPPGQRSVMLKLLTEQEEEFLRQKLDPSGKQDLRELLSTMTDGWNSEQAMIAVGSGGAFGNGWRGGHQTRLGFLPEAHTDFVFPVFCEQWGFAGSILIISLYWLLLWTGFRIASEAGDSFGKLLATGITSLIAWHVLFNISMSLGMLPIAGLPLPLMSYGGSSVLMTMIALGILEAVHIRRLRLPGKGYSL